MSVVTSAAARRAVTYGLGPLLTLGLTQALQSGEQISLSQAADGIKAHFHTTDVLIGLLPLAMAATGLFGAIPMGRLTDTSRRTRLIAAATVLWAFCMAGVALSASLLMLFVLRMGLGGIEASSMAAVSLVADYYPVVDRAKRIGMYSGCALLGALFSFAVGGVLVDTWGWRAAFWPWIPLAAVVTFLVLRLPEPARGEQDADHAAFLAAAVPPAVTAALVETPADAALDASADAEIGWREVFDRLRTVPSFWCAILGVMMAQLLLIAAQFWGIPYFKRVHGFSTSKAGGLAGAFGAGAILGIIFGGFVSDRLVRRGVVNARAYVAASSAALAVVTLGPAWYVHNLVVGAPLFVLGAMFLTGAIPPTEALIADVVPANMRGRANTIRSAARVLSNAGPFVVAVISTGFGGTKGTGLRMGLTLFTPIMLFMTFALVRAARTYPRDLAAVCSEAEQRRSHEPSGSPIP